MLLEVVGGILSGSLALLADAGHMLTDAAALLFALLAVQFSRRPPTVRHTFGWLRLTTLAAFVNAIALVVITMSTRATAHLTARDIRAANSSAVILPVISSWNTLAKRSSAPTYATRTWRWAIC
ncbi:hypothetical protein AU79_22280 [Salmonella enterica subsp. enterica serovar Enteritidis str. SA19940857]|nr:hypothetical protein AU79_22280 [Salmonella enterica subsp. enterica serovar Enteritidis str. SA19940857]